MERIISNEPRIHDCLSRVRHLIGVGWPCRAIAGETKWQAIGEWRSVSGSLVIRPEWDVRSTVINDRSRSCGPFNLARQRAGADQRFERNRPAYAGTAADRRNPSLRVSLPACSARHDTFAAQTLSKCSALDRPPPRDARGPAASSAFHSIYGHGCACRIVRAALYSLRASPVRSSKRSNVA